MGREWKHLLILIILGSVFEVLGSKTKRYHVKNADILLPYVDHHGPEFHTHRHIRSLQPQQFNNVTHEIYPSDSSNIAHHPIVQTRAFVVNIGFWGYAYGHVFTVSNPSRTVSILEPHTAGGCDNHTRATVQDTARNGNCILATNAGFFNTVNGSCLGDVVSDGRLVQQTGVQNAHFGIRKDGSLFFGYIPEDLVIENEFEQLVSGVIWLVRDGQNFITSSQNMESSSTQETGSLNYFITVRSGRLAIGHDRQGRVVLVQVDGHTGERGVTLQEFADLLIKWGVVNAINLDGGGSITAVINGTLASYPGDVCQDEESDMKEYNCGRAVTTIVCVHEPKCQPADCSNHGNCVLGVCHCHGNWVGLDCNTLECGVLNCTSHGLCTQAGCVCEPGWRGAECAEACPSGTYGLNCSATCLCHNDAKCDPLDGSCVCPLGFTGQLCDQVCPFGFYGTGCQQLCFCDDSCGCHHVTGACNLTAYTTTFMQMAECISNRIMNTQASCDSEEQYRLWFVSTVFITFFAMSSVILNIVLLTRSGHSQQRSPTKKHVYHATYLIDASSEDQRSLESSSEDEQPNTARQKHKKPKARLKKRKATKPKRPPLNHQTRLILGASQAGSSTDSEQSVY